MTSFTNINKCRSFALIKLQSLNYQLLKISFQKIFEYFRQKLIKMNRLHSMKNNFKAYTLRMKDQRKQNVAILRGYLRKQRSVIIQNTRRRMIRGIFWIGLLSVSYYIGHRIYSQKLQVKQMHKKLTTLYPSIVTKIDTEGQNQVYYVVPQYDDQLANIIQMCWKYHYKVMVNSEPIDPQMKNQNILNFLKQIPQTVREKCILVNLQKLNKTEIDHVNGLFKVETGITCNELNQRFIKNGYQPLFPQEIAENLNETVYNALVNNYPTNYGPLSQCIANVDLISPQGQYFRSSNQNNQYGSTPNLNTIFLGTGGIFGLPLRTNLKTIKSTGKQIVSNLKLETNDLNQKLLFTRKLKQISSQNQNLFNFSISNSQNGVINISLKAKQQLKTILESVKSQLQIQIGNVKQKEFSKDQSKKFNIFFNVNQAGFQKFLILRQKKLASQRTLPYILSDDLLKVNCQDESLLIEVISEICSENGVVVWCKDHKFMRDIKKVTDESEVGSQLMKILVQIREGIDHKKIYYTHNRYEEYFAKGTFRKLTQVFW